MDYLFLRGTRILCRSISCGSHTAIQVLQGLLFLQDQRSLRWIVLVPTLQFRLKPLVCYCFHRRQVGLEHYLLGTVGPAHTVPWLQTVHAAKYLNEWRNRIDEIPAGGGSSPNSKSGVSEVGFVASILSNWLMLSRTWRVYAF